jgi:predicted nuclease with RNAse H fold
VTAGPWAGVDVGGRAKGFHVVVIDDRRIVAGPRRCRSVQDTLTWLGRSRPSRTAVDSPASLAPDCERSRPCERDFLAAGICRLRPTPDRRTLEARRDRYYEWIECGLDLYRALETAGITAIECFPTASWTRWAGARGARTRARWTREALPALELDGLPARTNQDERDAIAAAATARSAENGETEAFGDIVVPLPARG